MELQAFSFNDVKISHHIADVNSDWHIDVSDILAIIGTWGCLVCQEDIDGSGVVDVGDILMVINAW
tara:strand:+ start:38 stop:235 length:198 start_codon:yes stop_codon:yes gene_type:complete